MKKIILLICALIPFVLNAQITNFSSATGTPQTFISTNLLGEGINAFNVQYNGTTSFNSTNQVGTFINTNTTGNLPKIGKGIVLSTGAFNATNSANQNYQTSPYLRSLLNSLGQTSSINNVASFTFDFQSSLPQTSISSFDYFFATTEYPSYCTFADAFGFFIDGPYESDGTTRYTGNGMDYFESYYGKDIAVIPNSNATPVTVPALCSRVGTTFNGNSFTAGSTFGGYTIDLNTLSIVLLPGKIYKITIAICNYSDEGFSSSVFLSGGSFKAVPIITLEPSVITNNSASLDAIVLPSLGYTINGQGFQWRRKTVDNSESWIDVPINGVQIVYNLEGLIPNTIYEYRGYVSTEDGQTFGDTKTFTTLSIAPTNSPAVAYTSTTTNITTNSCEFNGGYIPGIGTGTTISEKGFEYKTNLIQNWTVVSDPTTTSTSDGATTTKIITGLNPGTYYTVRAYVVSMGGTKHYGSIIPFTTLAAFGAPTLVYNNITTNTATVIWNTIDGAESYTLQYKEQGTSTWSSEILATANNRNIVLDSLSGNKTYDVRIRSNTPSPNDPSSWNMSSFTTLLTAPINLTTSNKTQSSVVINWDSIVGANNYTIQYKLKSASSWITYPTNPTTNQVQLIGLSLAEYQVKVKANKTSPSSSSDWSSILEFSISNSIATPSCTASNITASSSSISWNAITDAVSYVFQYKLASSSSWSSEQSVSADNRLVNLISLDTNVLYDYRIKSIASDSSLNSGWGSYQFKTLLGTPISSASNITASSSSISWNAITDAVSYVFQYKLASSSSWSSEQSVNADNRLINLISLDTNALYDYRIKSIASDSSLNSGWGSYQFKTLLGTPISSASNITASSSSISWNAITDAVSYVFQYKLASSSSWSSEQSVNADNRLINLISLDTNALYDYRIKSIASDSSLNSGWGSYQFKTLLGTPISSASNITASSSSISWNAITDAVSYVFQYKLASSSSWSSEQSVNADNRLINLISLDTNALYDYRIKSIASDSSLNSGWGSYQFKTLLGTPISSASNITASSSSISWNAITDAVSYVFQYKLASSSSWSSEQSVNADNRLINLISLDTNALYDYRIKSIASDSSLNSGWGSYQFKTLLGTPISSASNITASSSSISWNAITDAVSYVFQYKLASSSSWSSEQSVNADNRLINLISLDTNALYDYRIKSIASDSSLNSGWGSYQFKTLLGTPISSASNITASSSSISWNAITDAVSYVFQYKLASSSSWSSEQSVNADNRLINLISLDTNALYDYRIKSIASDSSLNSGWGSYQFKTLLGTPISSASNITASSSSISWNAITDAVSYVFQYKLASSSSWSSEQSVNADNRLINLISLDTNALYDYRIKSIASDSSLNSGWGSYQFKTLLGTPISSASNITASSSSISWNAITDAVSYVFQYKLASSSSWSSEQSVNADNRLINLTSLDTNALYDYRIKSIASDSSLNSGWGSYQFKTLLGTPIGSASSITASSATISWNAVNAAVGYSFQYKLRTANNWSTIINIDTSDRSISLDNLNDNAIYDYRVMANASSPSQNSGWGLGEFYTLLRTPVCRIDSITSSSAFISWNEVNGAIGFVWQIKLKSSSQWSAENNVDISLRSINILNLEDNSIYDLRIRSLSYNSNSSERQNVSNGSINNNVNSEWGYYEIQTLLTTPNNVSVNNYTNTSVNLIWDNVNNADSYTIQYKEKGTSSWNTLNSTINSQLITGLNHLKEYEAQVNANSTSPANNSEWSAIIEFKPILATPILNVITNITTNNATINWNAINDAGSYDIEYQIDGGTEWTSGGNPTTLSQTLSSLQQGTYYKVRVKAKAISPNTNHSDWSNESSFTTICPKVTNINIPITYADSTSAMVNWTAGGTETSWLLKYKVLPSGEWSNEITVNTTPEYILTNLLAGTMYQVSISTPCQDATSIETTEEFVTSTTNLIIRDNFTLDLVSKIVNQSNSNLNIIFRVSASPFDGSTLGQSIGNGTNPFSGRIIFVDDSGNEIENGSVIINNLTTPLFGVVVETNIHNITLTNVNITSSSQSTGGLINDAIGTIIRNCSVNGNITGENNTGGLIGNTDEASIDSSSFSGTVNGIDMVGGLVGNHNNCSVIRNSSASVNIIGQTKVGGLVGFSNCYVGNSHATGNISAINMGGGLVGYCNGAIRKSYSTCQIIRSFGNDNLFGGLVGSGFGNEDKSFYQTPVSFGVYNFRGKQSNNPANEPDLQ